MDLLVQQERERIRNESNADLMAERRATIKPRSHNLDDSVVSTNFGVAGEKRGKKIVRATPRIDACCVLMRHKGFNTMSAPLLAAARLGHAGTSDEEVTTLANMYLQELS